MSRCKDCKLEKVRNRAERHQDFFYYRDEKGRKWNGRVCPDCKVLAERRKYGNVAWDETRNPVHRSARRCEILAGEHFRALGHAVERNATGFGPDLVLDGKTRVEVKKVGLHSGSYRVGRVRAKRRNDDLIAFVLLPDKIVVEPMAAHLAVCQTDGQRTVTRLFRETST